MVYVCEMLKYNMSKLRISITSRTSSKYGQIGPRTAELTALERLEKSPLTYKGKNVVTILAP